jgi:hypothetical protein
VNGLYKLEITMAPKHEQPTSLLLLVEWQLAIELWHKRMGHIGFQGLHQLSRLEHSSVHSNYYGGLWWIHFEQTTQGKCTQEKCDKNIITKWTNTHILIWSIPTFVTRKV